MALRTLRIETGTIVEERPTTYLSADVAAASGTITVKNINGIAVNNILLIGELGSEGAEIIKTHASTAPSEPTVTLASNTRFAHTAFSKVTTIPYDQIEISHAATEAGVKSVLATVAIDGLENVYDDSAHTSGYYFYRFKNSIGAGTYSDYSDPIPFDGFDMDTVGYAVAYALRRNHTNINERITESWLLAEINACLRYITGKRKKWSKLQEFGYTLGQTNYDVRSFALPGTIYDQTSNKSVLSVQLQGSLPLTWMDKKEFNILTSTEISSAVRTQATAGQTTLNITDSYGFADSGSIDVYVSGVKYTVTYTGVTRSSTAGVLTGVPASGDGSITVTIPVAALAVQNRREGCPQYFTIWNGTLYLDKYPDSNYVNKNVILDFWTAPTQVNSMGDTLDSYRYDMIQDWLTWVIRAELENNGKRPADDADFLMFREKLSDAKRMERTGQKYKTAPNINTIDYNAE